MFGVHQTESLRWESTNVWEWDVQQLTGGGSLRVGEIKLCGSGMKGEVVLKGGKESRKQVVHATEKSRANDYVAGITRSC